MGKLNEHNIEYLTEYVIPTLISKKDVFEHPGIPKVFVSTRQRSYHYFPDVWTRPDNDNLEEPLVGLELEVYARNSSVLRINPISSTYNMTEVFPRKTEEQK